MENLELDFKLTVTQVNIVLKYLGGGVYVEVADLITLLHNQAKPQIEDAVIAETVDPTPAE